MVIADFAYQDGCRGGNLRIAANGIGAAVIAIESAFPVRGLTLSRRRGPQPRIQPSYFTTW
jgi:hypothetical protein